MEEDKIKANILKESLQIVYDLAKIDIEDFNIEDIEKLVKKAKQLKRNVLFKL
jgi:hypothetical protein